MLRRRVYPVSGIACRARVLHWHECAGSNTPNEWRQKLFYCLNRCGILDLLVLVPDLLYVLELFGPSAHAHFRRLRQF